MKTTLIVLSTMFAVTFGNGYLKQSARANLLERDVAFQQTEIESLEWQRDCPDCYELTKGEELPADAIACNDKCFEPSTDTECYQACERDSETPEELEECLTASYL